MGRPKNFDRNKVLTKALPLFWARGFADARLQDLEKVTGVNRSGLYSEFKNKEDLFIATLRHYGETIESKALLTAQPLGWGNIERFLERTIECPGGNRGCFTVNSMREIAILPSEAQEVLTESRSELDRLLIENIGAERTKMAPEALAAILSTFFSGICIELNFNAGSARAARKAKDFLQVLRTM
jgi:AcrR family transcriptional regulator